MSLTWKQKLICWLAFAISWALQSTYRFRWYGLAHYEAARQGSPTGSVAFACWHQNAFASVIAHAYRRLAVIASRSFDGEVIAYVVKRFGIASARGSSSRGGREALREIIDLVSDGFEAGVTVDGPRGPAYKVKPGVISIASRTGVPIVPLAAVGRRTWTFSKSWDQSRLPKPFTEVLCVYGSPIFVPSQLDDASMQHYTEALEQALQRLERSIREAAPEPSAAEHRGHRPMPSN